MSKYEIYDQVDIRLYDESAHTFLEKKEQLGYKRNTDLVMDMIKAKSIYIKFFLWLTSEYRKQGNNINQLTKRANTNNTFTNDDRELLKNLLANQEIIISEVRKNYVDK